MATVGKNILDNLTTGMYLTPRLSTENIYKMLVIKLILQ